MKQFAHGITITVHRLVPGARDARGNLTYTSVDADYVKCAWWPVDANAQTTNETFGDHEQAVIGFQCILPIEADVSYIDSVTLGGNRYTVYGKPMSYVSPITGHSLGVLCSLQLVEG